MDELKCEEFMLERWSALFSDSPDPTSAQLVGTLPSCPIVTTLPVITVTSVITGITVPGTVTITVMTKIASTCIHLLPPSRLFSTGCSPFMVLTQSGCSHEAAVSGLPVRLFPALGEYSGNVSSPSAACGCDVFNVSNPRFLFQQFSDGWSF